MKKSFAEFWMKYNYKPKLVRLCHPIGQPISRIRAFLMLRQPFGLPKRHIRMRYLSKPAWTSSINQRSIK